jgi:hypothetical protein
MTRSRFNLHVEERINDIKSSLLTKGVEYAFTDNVFHNFETAARALDTSPAMALLGMYIKHYVSVLDLANGKKPLVEPVIREKIGDMINYLILLEAMLIEQSDELPF